MSERWCIVACVVAYRLRLSFRGMPEWMSPGIFRLLGIDGIIGLALDHREC